MSFSPGSSSGIAVAVTVVVLFSLGATAIFLTVLSRRRQEQRDCETSAEQLEIEGQSLHVGAKPPALPIFKTRSSLSRSSPLSPKSTGGRFSVALPRHYGRRIVNFEGLPSVESVLQKYEEDEKQVTQHEMCEETELGEPGPAVPTESPKLMQSVPYIKLEQV